MTVGRLLGLDFRDPGLNLIFGPNRLTRATLLAAVQTEIYKTASSSSWTDMQVYPQDSLTREDGLEIAAALARSEQVFAPGESVHASSLYTVTLLGHLTAGVIVCPRYAVPRNLTTAEANMILTDITSGVSTVSSALSWLTKLVAP